VGDDGGASLLGKGPASRATSSAAGLWGVGVMVVSGNRRSMGMCLDFELGQKRFQLRVIDGVKQGHCTMSAAAAN